MPPWRPLPIPVDELLRPVAEASTPKEALRAGRARCDQYGRVPVLVSALGIPLVRLLDSGWSVERAADLLGWSVAEVEDLARRAGGTWGIGAR